MRLTKFKQFAILFGCLGLATNLSLGFEYELDGHVKQTLTSKVRGVGHATASFTLYVRDDGWLIDTVETNELGEVVQRHIASTNASDIFECVQPLGMLHVSSDNSSNGVPIEPVFAKSPSPMFATVETNCLPVGNTGTAVVGHLWLMLASRGYWSNLDSDRLTPIYDWQASSSAHGQFMKMRAGWELLGDRDSLPRKVWYLGTWGETNGLYIVTQTNSVNGMLVASSFVFEQFEVGPLSEETLIHEMISMKRVDVSVTSIRPKCSKDNLIPAPTDQAYIIDRRFDSGIPNQPPSYRNPVAGKWPTIEESKRLAFRIKDAYARSVAVQKPITGGREHQAKYRRLILYCMLLALTIPPAFVFFARKFGRHPKQ